MAETVMLFLFLSHWTLFALLTFPLNSKYSNSHTVCDGLHVGTGKHIKEAYYSYPKKKYQNFEICEIKAK